MCEGRLAAILSRKNPLANVCEGDTTDTVDWWFLDEIWNKIYSVSWS